ncbi:MAG: hypothetical protein FWG93_04240, partial [Oscillospiraceae bacterium]|nr:hypothetical protein [Oscillospiraceae bacterium]
DVAGLTARGQVFSVGENDLRFTEPELDQYFRELGITPRPDELREILRDTEGRPFPVSLIARSIRSMPGYGGGLRGAVRASDSRLAETEIWDKLSGGLRDFWLRLSLIEHPDVDLAALLAGGDARLIEALESQSACLWRDDAAGVYRIQPLFLDFLRRKQHLLTEAQTRETCETAALWCDRNGFKLDALGYYERAGDYASVVRLLFEMPPRMPEDVARYARGIFERAPAEAFYRVDLLAAAHLRTVMYLGLWREAFALAEHYEAKYLRMPEDSVLRNHTLGGIYYCWGILRMLLCTVDDRYDFDVYFAKMDQCLSRFPADLEGLVDYSGGSWISLTGSAREGAPREYIEAFARAVRHVSHCLRGAMAGLDDLARGELKFYQGDVRAAEGYILRGMESAREHRQLETVQRALFCLLRLAVAQGNCDKAEETLKEMEALSDGGGYSARSVAYDAARTWFFCMLDQPEKTPGWLKEAFSSYGHAYSIENFGNQAKARYCYRARDYLPLLAYIEEQNKREAILFGRVEMLAKEACVYYIMKDKTRAFAALRDAYEASSPNGVIMPFALLGKDMRTLTSAALKEPGCDVPKAWLREVCRRAASYAKRQAQIIAGYRQSE